MIKGNKVESNSTLNKLTNTKKINGQLCTKKQLQSK